MNNLFLRNLGLVLVLNLAIKPLYIFGIDRSVQNAVGPEDYGLFFALFNFSYLFQILHDLGVQNFNHVHFSKHPKLINKYLPSILGSKMVMSLVYLLVIMMLAMALDYDISWYPLLGMIAINHILISLALLLRTSLSAQGFYRLDSILSVTDKMVLIILVGIVLIRPSWRALITIEFFVYAQTFAFATAAVIALILLKIKGQVHIKNVKFNKSFHLWLVRRSLPFALVLLLMSLYTRMDAVMLERMLSNGQYQAGLYAAGYRLLDAANMLGVLCAGLLMPMMSKNMSDRDGLASLQNVAFRFMWTAGLLGVVASVFFADEIMSLLYTDSTADWSAVFAMLMGSYLATCMAYVFGTMLTAGEKLKSMNKIFLVGVMLNFVLNLIMIPRLQAYGSALATVVTQSVVSIALVVTSLRLYSLDWRSLALGRAALIGIGIISLFYLVDSLTFPWMINCSLGILGGLLISHVLGFLPFSTFTRTTLKSS